MHPRGNMTNNHFNHLFLALEVIGFTLLGYFNFNTSQTQMNSRDPWNSYDRLLNESSYTLYVAFMAILFALVSQLHRSLAAGSLKQLRIAIVLFFINFFAAWWALQQTTHRPVVHSHSIAFHIIFYITMILGPGFLLHVLVLELLGWLRFNGYIQDMLICKYNLLCGPRTPTGSPPKEPVASTAGSYNVETKSTSSSGDPNTDIENNFSQTMPSIATHQKC